MKNKTLLQLAKESKRKGMSINNVSEQEIELALAWCKNEVSLIQCQKAFNLSQGNSVYLRLLHALKAYTLKNVSNG